MLLKSQSMGGLLPCSVLASASQLLCPRQLMMPSLPCLLNISLMQSASFLSSKLYEELSWLSPRSRTETRVGSSLFQSLGWLMLECVCRLAAFLRSSLRLRACLSIIV